MIVRLLSDAQRKEHDAYIAEMEAICERTAHWTSEQVERRRSQGRRQGDS